MANLSMQVVTLHTLPSHKADFEFGARAHTLIDLSISGRTRTNVHEMSRCNRATCTREQNPALTRRRSLSETRASTRSLAIDHIDWTCGRSQVAAKGRDVQGLLHDEPGLGSRPQTKPPPLDNWVKARPEKRQRERVDKPTVAHGVRQRMGRRQNGPGRDTGWDSRIFGFRFYSKKWRN